MKKFFSCVGLLLLSIVVQFGLVLLGMFLLFEGPNGYYAYFTIPVGLIVIILLELLRVPCKKADVGGVLFYGFIYFVPLVLAVIAILVLGVWELFPVSLLEALLIFAWLIISGGMFVVGTIVSVVRVLIHKYNKQKSIE